MQAPIYSKITPLLRAVAARSAVIPVLAEGSPEQFNELVNAFDSLGLSPYQQAPVLGYIAGLATPDLVVKLAAVPEITGLFPDLLVNALSVYIGTPTPVPGSIKIKTPVNTMVNMLDTTFNRFAKNFSDAFYNKVLAEHVERLLNMPLDLPDPLAITMMPFETLAQGVNGFQQLLDNLETPLEAEEYLPVMEIQSNLQKGVPTSYTRKLLGLDEAELQGITGKGVKLAVIDTGVDLLSAQIPVTTDFDNAMTAHPLADENGHGTHCAATAFGTGTINYRNVPVKGMAPDAIPIAIKALGGGIGTGRNSDVLKAMEMAYMKGADVISMSLGSEQCNGTGPNPCDTCPLCKTVRRLTEIGKIFVIAAGNSGPGGSTIGCPGCEESAITVGAVSPVDDQVAPFSSRGPTVDGREKPDIASYGVKIYAATSFGSLLDTRGDGMADGFTTLSGTSMATPHEAGIIADVKQAYPDITAADIKAIFAMKGHAKNNDTGYGIARWSWFGGR